MNYYVDPAVFFSFVFGKQHSNQSSRVAAPRTIANRNSTYSISFWQCIGWRDCSRRSPVSAKLCQSPRHTYGPGVGRRSTWRSNSHAPFELKRKAYRLGSCRHPACGLGAHDLGVGHGCQSWEDFRQSKPSNIVFTLQRFGDDHVAEDTKLENNAHTILGTVVVALLLFRPLFGFLHHRRFMATRKRGKMTLFHVWYGRVLILLGMLNGGFGLKLATNSPGGNIAYGVVAGVIGATYVAVMVHFEVTGGSKTSSRTPDVPEETSKSQSS